MRTSQGKKKVYVPKHNRGGTVVRPHYRSTPNPPKPAKKRR